MPFPCLNLVPIKGRAGSGYHRCGKCVQCRELRRYGWLLRAAREQVASDTAWFVTLTFGPNARRDVLRRATLLGEKRPNVPVVLRMAQASGVYVTKYVKRVRKAGFGIRYLFVSEPHKDGFPHWHGLIFTVPGKPRVTWEVLHDQWPSGFSVIKLVKDARAMHYVTKYLSKGNVSRIRASRQFGADATKDCEHST